MSRKNNSEVKIFFISALLTISIFLCTINTRALASQGGEIIWTQTSDPSDGDDSARALAVDDSGLYVVGYDESPGDRQWRIEKRSLTDGTIIWFRTSNPSGEHDSVKAVAVDDSGLYVAGDDFSLGDGQWRIEKRMKISSVGGIGTLINVTHRGEWYIQRILLYLILAVISLIVFISFKK